MVISQKGNLGWNGTHPAGLNVLVLHQKGNRRKKRKLPSDRPPVYVYWQRQFVPTTWTIYPPRPDTLGSKRLFTALLETGKRHRACLSSGQIAGEARTDRGRRYHGLFSDRPRVGTLTLASATLLPSAEVPAPQMAK